MDTLNPRIIKGSQVYNNQSELFKSTGGLAVLSAKSILSTEIMKIIEPINNSNWTRYSICSNIMNNIDLNQFIGIDSPKLMESLLYNEFYKISLEVNPNASIEAVDKVMDYLRPTINSVITLLNRVDC